MVLIALFLALIWLSICITVITRTLLIKKTRSVNTLTATAPVNQYGKSGAPKLSGSAMGL